MDDGQSHVISLFTIQRLFCLSWMVDTQVHKCTSVPHSLVSVHVKLNVASWSLNFKESYLCTLRCRRVFGWPVHHTAIPRSEAQDWYSYGYVSEGPAHSDCYTSTTLSMLTSLRSLWKQTHRHNHSCARFMSLISFHTHVLLT